VFEIGEERESVGLEEWVVVCRGVGGMGCVWSGGGGGGGVGGGGWGGGGGGGGGDPSVPRPTV